MPLDGGGDHDKNSIVYMWFMKDIKHVTTETELNFYFIPVLVAAATAVIRNNRTTTSLLSICIPTASSSDELHSFDVIILTKMNCYVSVLDTIPCLLSKEGQAGFFRDIHSAARVPQT